MLVTFGLGSPSLIPTLGLGSDAAGPVTPGEPRSLSAGLLQNIIATDEFRPLIGSKAMRLGETAFNILGYHYDRKRFIDETDIRTINPGFVGNLTDGLSDGTILDYWQSGIGAGEDCDVFDIVEHLNESLEKWSPRVHRGEYFSYLTNFYLFADHHIEHPLIAQFVESFQVDTDSVLLEFIPDSNSPIIAGIYRRESDKSAFPWRVAELVGSFTGIIVEPGERADTLNDDGTPNYANVDPFLRWELYYDKNTNRLYFNRNMARLFGLLDPSVPGDLDRLELIGTSDGSGGQKMYTRYFPIDPGRIVHEHGYVHNDNHVLYVGETQWSIADDNDLSFHDDNDEVYQIDYDLGIIQFGGSDIDAILFLANDISDTDTEITLLGDIEAIPAKGVLLVDSEYIAYHGKTKTQLVQVQRGFRSSLAVPHSQYTSLDYQVPGKIPASSSDVRMGYYTTPRIEYAVEKGGALTVADDVDSRPSHVPEGNGIVYITRVPVSLQSLVLEVDKPLISGTIYGPLNVGADYALLTATAYSPSGEVVARLPVTIEQISAPPFIGLLNGAPSDYNSITNYSGQITTSYVVGSDISSIFLTTTDVVQASGQTLVTIAGNHTSFDLEEIYIYVVTKDDPAQGTVGLLSNYEPGSISTSDLLPGSNQRFTTSTMKDFPTVVVGDVYPDDVFNGGTLDIYRTDGTSVSGTIKYWRNGIAYIEEVLPVVDGDIDFLVLNKPDWIEWNASTLNGKKRVLYVYNSLAINPVTNALGAYFPIQPTDRIYSSDSNQTTFVFDTLLPEADATDIENNVGGYMLTVPRLISFRAKATDPLSGRQILSNTIDIRVFLPDYLNGVYLSESGRIPYGFRIRDDELSAASGLDGATFVTINPVAGSVGAVSNPFATMIHLISV